MGRKLFWIGLAVVGVGLLAWWISTLDLERRTKEIDLGWSPRARRDPLLAARLLLEQLEVEVSDADTSQDPPDPSSAAFLALPGQPMAPEREARWRAWIENGGLLVLSLPFDGPRRRRLDVLDGEGRYSIPIAGDLGLELVLEAEAPERERDAPLRGWRLSKGPRAGLRFEELHGAHVGERSFELRVPSGARRFDWSDTTPDGWVFGDDGVWMVAYSLGKGQLVVTADDVWLSNDGIARAENAALLAELASWRERVVLLRDLHRESLLTWLYQTAWPALLALGAALALWIWRRAPRTGPWLPQPSGHEQSFLEHLGANGAYLWRHRGREALLEPLRRSVRAQLERRRPDLAGADARSLAAVLADASGQDPRTLESALGARSWTPRAFVRDVRALVQARKRL
ncbi:MAG: DUF4350 domain-containing protein [Planctomycetota bacterium]|nr:MAG: DUF4350 domain-containing protein [Planctomycetota bacterium]